MHIEITQASQKLTEKLLNQMPRPTVHIMRIGEVLGYVRPNLTKPSIALIKYDSEYYSMPLNWVKEDATVTRLIDFTPRKVKKTESMNLGTGESAILWWKNYQRLQTLALKKHIYLAK